jgi:hypothetical protein
MLMYIPNTTMTMSMFGHRMLGEHLLSEELVMRKKILKEGLG